MAAVVPAITIGKGHGAVLAGHVNEVPPDGVVGVDVPGVGGVVVSGVVGVDVSGVVGVVVSGVVGVVVGVVVVMVAACTRFDTRQNTAMTPPNKRTNFCDIFP